jgi:hypothetical protein
MYAGGGKAPWFVWPLMGIFVGLVIYIAWKVGQ